MTRLRDADAAARRESGLGRDHSEALARGLQIMAMFDEAHRAQTLSEVAERTRLPRATARRALLTLLALGFVEQDGRVFRLTARVLRLAAAYLTSNAVSVLLQPACDRVMRAVGESCTGAVLEDDEVVMIARALPAQLVPAGVGIGYRLPAYCSALGRVLLSGLSDAALEAYLARTVPTAQTPFTKTEIADVRDAVQAVKAEGYCFVDQEAEVGFRSVAVPLRRFDGTLVAALNVGARVERADPAAMTGKLLAVLRAEAEGLSGLLI